MRRASITNSHENRLLGIILVMGAFIAFTGIDSMSKVLTELGYHAIFITWGRLVAQVIMLGPLLLRNGLPGLRAKRPGLQIVRGLCMLGAGVSFVSGLNYLPLATVTAINFVSPFVITILTVVVLKEHVGYHRWIAIAIGFTGAMIVIRPGTDSFNLGSLFPLASAGCFATSMIVTRILQRTDSSLLTIFYTCVVGLIGSSLLIAEFWKPVTPMAVVLLIGMGIGSTIGQSLMNRALSIASPAVLAPLHYSQLIWAALAGVLLFGEFPDRWTWIGAAIIVASGLYVWHRERRLAAAPVPTG